MNSFGLKNYRLTDTIAAIATAPGAAAIGVVKLSGSKALAIAARVFQPQAKTNVRKAKTYTMYYGWVTKKDSNAVIDEVILSIMRKPRSPTSEDMVEISCHGGVVVTNVILERLLEEGARLALPGEFTYRALVHGRIDLLQAEGILDIVHARTQEGLRVATRQLQGYASARIGAVREKTTELYAQMQAALNFPEDDVAVSQKEVHQTLSALCKDVEKLIAASFDGAMLKEGVRCVICGKTNVGKSTLFNRLLKEERVIVSRIPGTTRDVIEETISIRGIPLRMYDTAGLLEAKDLVTRKALQRSVKAFEEADLIIVVFDRSRPLGKDDRQLIARIAKRRQKTKVLVVAVLNKSDLPQKLAVKTLEAIAACRVSVSALHNKGIAALEKAIVASVGRRGIDRHNAVFLNQYQRVTLEALLKSLQEADSLLTEGHSLDMVDVCLRESVESVGNLSTEVVPEEVLKSLFSKFCIGK